MVSRSRSSGDWCGTSSASFPPRAPGSMPACFMMVAVFFLYSPDRSLTLEVLKLISLVLLFSYSNYLYDIIYNTFNFRHCESWFSPHVQFWVLLINWSHIELYLVLISPGIYWCYNGMLASYPTLIILESQVSKIGICIFDSV